MATPGVGFDCSGLTSWAWGQAGRGLPHSAAAQAAMLPSVPLADIQPGDLVFFYSPISHVGMYVGNGMMIHAPNTGDVVKLAPLRSGSIVKIGRP
jgi:cell wall-associated NlpC family hydrolase